MKINITNVPEITAAIAAVSGTARTGDILDAAQNAEQQLISQGFTKRQRKGATLSYRNGSTVTKLVRGSSSWFVVELWTSNIRFDAMVWTFLTLSPEQDQIEVARFRAFYGVASV